MFHRIADGKRELQSISFSHDSRPAKTQGYAVWAIQALEARTSDAYAPRDDDNEIFMSGMMQFVPLFYREARARYCSETLQLRHMQDTDTGKE